MPNGDRFSDLAPWVAFAFCLCIIAGVSFWFAYSKGYQTANEQHQADRKAYDIGDKAYEECSRLATSKEALDCYSKAEKASREDHRSEQDLNAQREMANWAEAMLIVSGVIGSLSIGITGLGVYWVKETLVETRKAVKAADDAVVVTREIGRAQVRAYLSPNIEKFFRQDGQANPLQIWMTIKNTGQSPALRVSHATAFVVIGVQLHESHDFIDHFKFDDNFFALGAGDVSRGDMHWVTEDELSGIMAGHLFCYIAALARYQDVFSNETWHITRHAYMLRPDPMSAQGPGLEPFGWGGITNNQQT